MIFIGGIGQGQRELDYRRAALLCAICGGYGRYQVFMTYTYFSFFFIPLFKWNRRYYVKTTCCGSVYELDPEVGRAIARGEDAEIRQEHLRLLQRGGRSYGETAGNWGTGAPGGWQDRERMDMGSPADGGQGESARELKSRYGEDFRMRSCPHCGYQFVDHEKEFAFCPRCGNALDKQEQKGEGK
ncbi:MAG TPA: zinc-ribbon domain-containing protein [Candidatus Lachnoclostridium stercoripullorum]|uniref:Zinc-ribbon domain-containing protein n=1 Tax=Candidatus Lachnoclostridium stercoripullorum TaxID=2838635 RepID=A0A9D1W455_9FIRM|nr:zinc-ribbon domain-containing protein [Candidatus Lachnoclostridium stercoripullorum]